MGLDCISPLYPNYCLSLDLHMFALVSSRVKIIYFTIVSESHMGSIEKENWPGRSITILKEKSRVPELFSNNDYTRLFTNCYCYPEAHNSDRML